MYISQNPELFKSLTPLVTKYTMPNVMTFSTDIPPHTKILKDVNEFETKLHDMSSKVYYIYVGLKKF